MNDYIKGKAHLPLPITKCPACKTDLGPRDEDNMRQCPDCKRTYWCPKLGSDKNA